MSEESKSTRRNFLKGGAIVAAPLAAIGAPVAALGAGDDRARIARLEDEKAIRALHASWSRLVNAGNHAAAAKLYADDKCACALAGIASVAPDHEGAADALDFARDGKRASATYAALVEVETEIAPDHTLAQMLHAQGEGMVRTSERRTLEAGYIRTREGNWAIASLDFQRV
jgi:ketosteroid isomerase-like protein